MAIRWHLFKHTSTRQFNSEFVVMMLLTLLWLEGLQEAADEQVNGAHCVVRPLAQGSDEMFQVLSQVSKQECIRVRDWRLDDCRDRLEAQTKIIIITPIIIQIFCCHLQLHL